MFCQVIEVDVAIHSLKDLPTDPTEGLVLAAIPGREDLSDALISRQGCSLEELPESARIRYPHALRYLPATSRDLLAQVLILPNFLPNQIDCVLFRLHLDRRISQIQLKRQVLVVELIDSVLGGQPDRDPQH